MCHAAETKPCGRNEGCTRLAAPPFFSLTVSHQLSSSTLPQPWVICLTSDEDWLQHASLWGRVGVYAI